LFKENRFIYKVIPANPPDSPTPLNAGLETQGQTPETTPLFEDLETIEATQNLAAEIEGSTSNTPETHEQIYSTPEGIEIAFQDYFRESLEENNIHLSIDSQTRTTLNNITTIYIHQVYSLYQASLINTPSTPELEAERPIDLTHQIDDFTNQISVDFENEYLEDTVNLAVTLVSQLAYNNPQINGRQTFSLQDLARLQSMLIATSATVLTNETNETNLKTTEFSELMTIIHNQNGEANFTPEQLDQLINFLELGTDYDQYINNAGNALNLDGHQLIPTSNSMLANALRDSLTRNQIAQVLNHLNDQPSISASQTELITNTVLYSQVGFTPFMLRNLLENNPNPNIDQETLLQNIGTKYEEIQEEIRNFMHNNPEAILNQNNTDIFNNNSRLLSVGAMALFGLGALVNLIYGISSAGKNNNSFIIAAGLGAAATVASDVSRGLSPTHTLGNLARGLFVDDLDVSLINQEQSQILMERTWLSNPNEEEISMLENEHVIAVFRETYRSTMLNETPFDFETIKRNLRNKSHTVDASESAKVMSAITTLEQYFIRKGLTNQNTIDQQLLTLAHIYTTLDISSEVSFEEKFARSFDPSIAPLSINDDYTPPSTTEQGTQLQNPEPEITSDEQTSLQSPSEETPASTEEQTTSTPSQTGTQGQSVG